MPAFDRKEWLDANVVPLLQSQTPPLQLYSVFWNGHPPKDVLVLLLAAPEQWPTAARAILEAGFTFDYTREVQIVQVEGKKTALFGGDGAPLFDKSGAVSARFFKKVDGQPSLILQLGARCDNEGGLGAGVEAASLVKTFFGQFSDNALTVCQRYGARFGQA